MDNQNAELLAMLRDIKRMLLGIALILFALAACAAGWLLRNAAFNAEGLSLIAAPLLLAYGAVHIWEGWTRREPENDKPQEQEQQGGTHAL